MVKINVQVEDAMRGAIRELAIEHGSSVEAVTRVLLDIGLTGLMKLSKPKRSERIPARRYRTASK